MVCRCLPSGVRPVLYAAAKAAGRTSRKEIAFGVVVDANDRPSATGDRKIARQARTVYHSGDAGDKEDIPV